MSMTDKQKEKAARIPAIGVAGEQPSHMYNKTIIANENGSGNLKFAGLRADSKVDLKVVRDGNVFWISYGIGIRNRIEFVSNQAINNEMPSGILICLRF